METIFGYVISSVLGIITGIIGTILYEKMCDEKKKKKVKKIKDNLVTKDVFAEYAKIKESIVVTPVVSFGDSTAINIQPLQQGGVHILKASVNLKNSSRTGEKRDFVMALLKYIPPMDWKYYCEEKYSFKFKIRGNINGIQLEIKDKGLKKIVDEYILVTHDFQEYEFPLRGESSIWESIEEVCFIVFNEERYIQGDIGMFEIFDCKLDM